MATIAVMKYVHNDKYDDKASSFMTIYAHEGRITVDTRVDTT